MEQLILRCEDTMEGIFTAIYDAFVYKNRMEGEYQDNISIAIGDEGEQTLFAREINIPTNLDKAEKTIRTIQTRLGISVYNTLFHALCHYDVERASVVLGYLVRGFKKGRRIDEHLSDSYVMRVMELSRKAGNEGYRFKEHLRFTDMGQFLYGKIEPKCNVLPLMTEHFADRFPNENFIIFDEKRNYAIVHKAYMPCFFATGEEFRIDITQSRDMFEVLWKQYFKTMEIKERHNEKCQNTLLPKWYRKNMTEHII